MTTTIPAQYEAAPWEPEGTRSIYGTKRGGRVQVKIFGSDQAHGDVVWGAVVDVGDLEGDGWITISVDELRKLQADCAGALHELDSLSGTQGTLRP